MFKGKAIATVIMLCSPLMLPAVAHATGENVRLYGTLVAEPCVLRPGDENIAIDLGNIVDKYLYTYGRSPSQPFQLHLQACDLSNGKQVSVTFSGQESTALPGLLAVQPDQAGIAVGLEDQAGNPLSLNVQGGAINLQKGNNTLNFNAYVKGESAAIAKRNISRGSFTAVSTFTLTYQ